MSYTDNTKNNIATRTLLAAGAARISGVGEAEFGFAAGDYRISFGVGRRTDGVQVLVSLYDSEDVGESCDVLITLSSNTAADDSGTITAANVDTWVTDGELFVSFEATLPEPTGVWVFKVDTAAHSTVEVPATPGPCDFSRFLVDVGDGAGGGGSLTLSDDETLADEAADEAISERAAKAYVDTQVATAAAYDTTPWASGTTYAPNTIVRRRESLYFQADVTDSTGDDPIDGAPWTHFARVTQRPRMADEMISTVGTFHTAAAISSGTVAQGSGFGASGLVGVNVLSATTATNSGYRFQTVATVCEAAKDLVSEFVFMIPTSTSTKTVRIGFGDSTSSTAPTDGSYVEIVDGTISYYARASGVGSAHATTGTVTADTWYRGVIHWTSATACSIRVRTLDNATTILSIDVSSGLPSGTEQFGHGCVAWLNTGTTAVGLVALDYLGYDIIPGYDIDA